METIDPASISDELLVRDDGPEPAQVVPPVVAVVITNDPGPWLEETLRSLAEQDYPALSVLVLDNGSADDPTARIAAAMPKAFVRRRGAEGGFAAAANEAIGVVEGAMFLLFCHDDVALDHDAVRVMVEEAYRSNAAIVGPKVVDAEQPEVLLEVGMAVDHYAVPFSVIEPGEVDQEQHDGVRDVFFVSHTAMLVRTDLFRELGGFDAGTAPGADDVDLCWRARLAGARVLVAPSARARHRRARPSERRRAGDHSAAEVRAETRARVRVLCKSYSAVALVWVVPTAFVLSVGESCASLLSGKVRRAGALIAGWLSALAHPIELRRARRTTQRSRRVEDADVRDLMIRGSARVRTYFTHRVHADDRLVDMSNRARARMTEMSGALRRAPAVVAIVLGVLVLAGSRTLLFGHVPEVGGLRAWPGAGSAWSTFTASWRATMMGAGRAASPAFALMAASTATLLGHAGMARSLVIGGALPLGAFGAYRLVRSFAASALPGVAAAVAYAVNPIIRNAVWRGELGPIVCFALAPFLLGAFVRAVDPGAPRRARWHAAGTITLLGIACGAVWPPAIGFALLIAVAFCLALPFTGDAAVVKRGLVVGAGTTAAVAVLLAPWSLTLLGADAATFGAFPRAPLSLADLLRFHTGAAGAGLAPWGILAAAAVPLAFATGPRLTWSIRAWTLALASFALAWIPGRIDGGASVLSPDGVLIGAALGLAFAAGLGIAAILDDLRRFHFGWRQVMTVVGVVGLGWAMIGFAGDTLSGRFGLGSEDWPSTYSWMQDNPPPGGFRVLWLGDATVLPADAKVASGIGYATTLDGSGDARALWAAPAQHSDRAIGDALRAATSGTTARLGHLLAPAGVRYIAFVQRAAPHSGPYGLDQSALADALGRQLDLTLSRSDDSGVVYQNDAWMPMRSFIPPASASSLHIDGTDPASAAERSEAVGVKGVAVSGSRTEPIGPGTLLWSWAASHGWHASANGRPLSRRDAFGWTNAFALDGSAPVRINYRGDLATMVGRTLEIVLWIGLIAAWFVTRRRSRRRAPAAGREQLVDLT